MRRLKWVVLSFVLCLLGEEESAQPTCGSPKQPLLKDSSESRSNKNCCPQQKEGCCANCSIKYLYNTLKNGNVNDTINAIESFEKVLEDTNINNTLSISFGNVVAYLYKPSGIFQGLNISASDNEIMSDKKVPNSKVAIHFPKDVNVGLNNTIVFCMMNVANKAIGTKDEIYEDRLIGLSVRGKIVSGLQECVKINITLTTTINETQYPSCQFFNFSTREFNKNGCDTEWLQGQGYIHCCCNHLTYFGVLLLPSGSGVSGEDQEILTYITLIGCSLSLFALVITVLLFVTHRKIRADPSMKVHINLAIALILLNLHFLPSQWVATLPSTGLCLYIAVGLHYFLLATFTWMAIEGFNLYLLLVRVFNIYVSKYLLKLSLVGWGVPVVIVGLVLIIDTNAYGHVWMDSSNSNTTAICYITDDKVKVVTTMGVFGMVFLFNLTIFGVTIKHIVLLHRTEKYGQRDHQRTQRDIFTMLGITTLLGITWGLVFFSFGYLTTPGLYLFCILNSLQGVFIFLWFVMSLRKTPNSAATSSETRTTNS